MKRALAPLAAVLGLKPEGLPAMSTDTAPGFVSGHWQYLPSAPPDAVLVKEAGNYLWMGCKFAPGECGEVGGIRVEVSGDTTQDVHVGLPECTAPGLVWHETPLAEWDGKGER